MDEEKNPTSKCCMTKTKCFIICILVTIIIILYEYSLPKRSSSLTRQYMDSSIDQDRLKVLDKIVNDLEEKQKDMSPKSRSLWTKMFGSKSSSSRDKLVLLYTGFFGDLPWGWIKDTKTLNQWDGITCPHFHCRLTYNKSDIKIADAVIFHAEDMLTSDDLNELQLSRNPRQRWIFFPTESPANVGTEHVINGVFNWTMSYRHDADIFRPYGYYYPITGHQEGDFLEFMEGKDLFVVWLSSHLGLMRDKYVRRLRIWIKIDVFGKTGIAVGGRSGLCTKDSPDCKKHLKRYKFLLAFENSFCTDYITEKYWFALEMGVVPVVMGGADYEKMGIPGSYIHVKDFPTIKALADYLKRLDLNDKEYSKYFEWKNKYRVLNDSPWTCQLCTALNIDKRIKVYDRLEDLWWPERECGIKEDIVKKIIGRQQWNGTRKTRYD
ncbi:alpha-(1,3)-fucosyltransferase 6 [Exaiptasia diaphana]|uniref:Fucosyltransferase n=1 Tax=Exaiptasia diaphana TaxID=2652724 RepID=A0A913WTJ5_EXADI|nr:alpha-(1,3)-fucosyltransferase 6 [Exaiptasia diaphana]